MGKKRMTSFRMYSNHFERIDYAYTFDRTRVYVRTLLKISSIAARRVLDYA